MGCDKAYIRVGQSTMLDRIRRAAHQAGLAVRVLVHDMVPGCGPLGGILTGLSQTQAERVLFLACDMPLVTSPLLAWLARQPSERGIFVVNQDRPGFPLVLPRAAVGTVQTQLEKGRFALHLLARKMRAKTVTVPPQWQCQLANINTRGDLRRLLLVKEKFVK